MATDGTVRIDPIRRAWLRELGIERVWNLPGAAPAGAAPHDAKQAASVQEAAQSTGKEGVQPEALRAETEPAQAEALDMSVMQTMDAAEPSVLPGSQAHDGLDLPDDPDQAWDVLQALVKDCTACGLCKGRTQTVFGVGSRRARWMLVGEAPGEREDKLGEPFVGRAGKLLDSMLAAIGRTRQADVFIANVIKCRPPGNRDPLPEEVALCSPYLMRQIALIQPEMILVLGRFAAQTLLGTDARIGSLRGRVHEIEVQGRPVPVVVSYHPAYLLRSPAEKTKTWQDLLLALSVGGA
ncbi:Uracil DNA glycosylase superfamily protein [Pigmentiphaga humi]|uniref:Type-4 uracil-DNA glycosylase n=1 Tax=Pigmentiphaga humi TaxID=2478468 RepID=A0A3P4B7L6_9BURK|nr:uracil-DNA glycosylase [Pigmentiphaga humi]VCU72287.1 Uracil DNA glycosylase superfamily protein [Pigmentiphaga humi]